jgi:hypothetical protein
MHRTGVELHSNTGPWSKRTGQAGLPEAESEKGSGKLTGAAHPIDEIHELVRPLQVRLLQRSQLRL